MSVLPDAMHDLEDERNLLEQSMHAMEQTTSPAACADLAHAIALLGARYESVMQDSVYFVIREDRGPAVLEQAEERLDAVRAALKEMRAKTRHVKPINAHADDPDGFEHSIEEMVKALRAMIAYEDEVLLPLVDELDSRGTRLLAERMEIGMSRETSLPDPPENPILRKLATLKESVELALNDESTPWHPGLQRISGTDDEDPPATDVR